MMEGSVPVNSSAMPSVVLAPAVPREVRTIWHYTSAAGLIGILGGQPSLRAGHYRFLNDTEELNYGFQALEAIWGSYGQHLAPDSEVRDLVLSVISYAKKSLTGREVYVSCASMARDSLAQWRAYSGMAGYAVGLHAHQDMHVERVTASEVDENPTVTVIGSPTYQDMRIPPRWCRVVYEKHEQSDLLLKTLDVLVSDVAQYGVSCEVAESLAEYLVTNLLYLKHPAFAEECEVRAVTAFNPCYKRRFRETSYGVTPFLTLLGRSEETLVPDARTQEEIRCSGLEVREVLIGPGVDMDAAELGAEILLADSGHSAVQISRSVAPYR